MMVTTPKINVTVHCDGCGQEIDPDWCHCGEPMEGGVHENHSPINIGCDCWRTLEDPVFGFTGTSIGMTKEQGATVAKLLTHAKRFHHGDCVGSDEQAHTMVPEACDIIIHPPKNPGKRAFCDLTKSGKSIAVLQEFEYLERNHHIVDACEVLIATPKGVTEEVRSGTWATIRYARKQNRCIIIVWPDGTFTREDHANQLELFNESANATEAS